MKVMVTGGAGFIGSQLVKSLLSQKHKVSVLDSIVTGLRENIPQGIPFYQGDITDRAFVMKSVAEDSPEVIYHLAAQASVEESVRHPLSDANTNIIGTINILDAALEHKATKIIFSSTAAVYGSPSYLPIDEEHPLNALSPYGVSKIAGEFYIKLYKRLYGLDYTILRYSNVYGPGQFWKSEGGVITVLLRSIMLDRPFTVFGDGEQTRDFVFVQDVVKANLLALNRGTGLTINIGTKSSTTVNRLLEITAEILGERIVPRYAPHRQQDIRHSLIDNTLAKRELGWEPCFSLRKGLELTINYLQKAGSSLLASFAGTDESNSFSNKKVIPHGS